ncbi:MAG: hypothetical protein ACRDHE_00690, partial [Ktedonobacterales bacterium]
MRRSGISVGYPVIALALCVIAGLAGCGASVGANASATKQPTATLAPPTRTLAIPTDTPVPTSYPTPISQVAFTCPAVADGTSKTFTDSATGFSFSYPAS